MTEIATKPVKKALAAILADLDAMPTNPRAFPIWREARGKVVHLIDHLTDLERLCAEVQRSSDERQLRLNLRWKGVKL